MACSTLVRGGSATTSAGSRLEYPQPVDGSLSPCALYTHRWHGLRTSLCRRHARFASFSRGKATFGLRNVSNMISGHKRATLMICGSVSWLRLKQNAKKAYAAMANRLLGLDLLRALSMNDGSAELGSLRQRFRPLFLTIPTLTL